MSRVRVEPRGTIEVGPRFRRVDGYAVVVDGVERQPYLPLRAARREASAVKEALPLAKEEHVRVLRGARDFGFVGPLHGTILSFGMIGTDPDEPDALISMPDGSRDLARHVPIRLLRREG